jgi:hypothetical protein
VSAVWITPVAAEGGPYNGSVADQAPVMDKESRFLAPLGMTDFWRDCFSEEKEENGG